MYRNLKKLLDDRRISSTMLAAQLGVTQKTAYNKINGKVDFYYSEVTKVMELFPEYSMNYVFENDGIPIGSQEEKESFEPVA